MVFISSLASIGPLKDASRLIDETTSPVPVTSYGRSKLLAEESLKNIKLPMIILRPTAVYGSRDKDIFIILKTFNSGFEPYIGRGAQQLSFVYVKDLAAVSVNALFTVTKLVEVIILLMANVITGTKWLTFQRKC
jgi:nucleoside-diphosphate-sugar epimerase